MADGQFVRNGSEDNSEERFRVDSTLDSELELLSHSRRRAILYSLMQTDEELVFLTNLAHQITRMEPRVDDIERVMIDIRHVHCPKLAEGGLVEYDDTSRTVAYTGNERINELLSQFCEYEKLEER